MKFKLLICCPGEDLEGGIPAVVKGMEKGFEFYSKELVYKKVIYGKRFNTDSNLKRVLLEIDQLFTFISTIITFSPSVILIESSFDKKTVLRDSLHLFFCKLLRKKMALHAHGGYWQDLPTWTLPARFLASSLIENVNFLIVTSFEEYEIIKKVFKNRVNLYKIDNPVFFPYEIKERVNFNSQVRVIFASRLIETKGVREVFEAAKLLRANNNIKFEIFGNGSLKDELAGMIERDNLQNVKLKGSVSLEYLLLEFQKGDIFLFPSYHKEGFPMALLFAVGSGMPIVATRVRPLQNFLTETINCMWVDDKNPKMISDKIVELSSNPDLMLEMNRANLKLIKKFEPRQIAGQYLKLLMR